MTTTESTRPPVAILLALALGVLLAALDQTIVATALPTVAGELGGLTDLAWVVTAYLVAETVSTPLYGKLGDVIGRKRVLIAAIVLFLAGSALSGLDGSMLELVLFRALQGLGAGGLIVTAMAVIADLVRRRDDVLADTEELASKLAAAVRDHRPPEGADQFAKPEQFDPFEREDAFEENQQSSPEEGPEDTEDQEDLDVEDEAEPQTTRRRKRGKRVQA